MRALQSPSGCDRCLRPRGARAIEALARSTAAQSGERRGRVRGGIHERVRVRKVGTVTLTMKLTDAACEAGTPQKQPPASTAPRTSLTGALVDGRCGNDTSLLG